MASDPNILIKKYFDEFYQKSIEVATQEAEIFIDSLQLSNLPIESKITLLNNELLSIGDDIEVFDRKEYVHFAQHEVILLNIFSSRLLLYGQNEKLFIEQALVLNSKRNLVIKQLNDLKSQLPPFSFSEFLRNLENIQFYVLRECPNGLSQSEYQKMKNFQTRKKFECVQFETSRFLKVFYSDIDKNNEESSIDQEKKQIAFIFKNAPEWNPERLFSEISSLKAINPENINKSDYFYDSFLSFCSGNVLTEKLTPGYLTESIKQIKNNQFSFPPVFCHSLITYESCLCEIERGKITLANYLNTNFEDIFEKTYKEGIKTAENQIKIFSSNYELDSITTQKYAEAIINELNLLRSDFKKSNVADYYNFLHDDDSLKALFFNNCLLAEEVENNINALKQSIIINEMVCFLMEEVVKIETISPDFKLSETDFQSILQIFHFQILMAPTSDILNQLLNALSETLSKLKNNRTPLWFIIEDFKESICEVYQHSINNLVEMIKSTDPGNLEPFIADKLRELNLKSLDNKTNVVSVKDCFESLKNIFQAEKEYLQSIRNINPLDIDKILNEKPTKEKPKLSFGYLKSDPQILYPYIHALCLKIDFLDYRTTVEDFIRIVTSKDLEKVKEKIHLGCATNEFAYVVEKLKPFFKSLKPANIEKSGLFISNFGNPLKANNLYNTDFENLQSKPTINIIFNQVQ
jgi:hypothetical protein